MKHPFPILAGAILAVLSMSCVPEAPVPYGALPSPQQVAWQQMETNMFCHFGPNTFTSAEWGTGKESADIFAPTDLDCRQWAATAAAAGMKGIIITAKHHDGFCLWPNPVSRHTVAQSAWREGKGDILRELSEACDEYGLEFGVYISPWDRNDPAYGTDEYNEVFRRTLESALSDYGPVFEQWFDGACGEGPNGKRQVYDWNLYHQEVYKHQPDAIIFSDIGPGCRWIGNEAGYAGETCWSTINTRGREPGGNIAREALNSGEAGGEAWVPGEADVSIRPGWFYKESENDRVKSLDDLLNIYYASVGRNSLLLLNVPPDTRGRIHKIDSVRLMEFRAALDEIFAADLTDGALIEADNVRGECRRYAPQNLFDDNYDTYWATDDGVTTATLTVQLDEEKTFNRILLQEYIPLGQRVKAFHVEALDKEGSWVTVAEGTTIGYKRILLTDRITTSVLRIHIDEAFACPVLNGLGLYLDEVLGREAFSWEKAEVAGRVMKADQPLEVDLKEVREVAGFYYEPMHGGAEGCIVSYRLEGSSDGTQWKELIADRIFENVVNNPIRQEVRLETPVKVRFLRLIPTRTSQPDQYGAAGFGAL